MIERSYEGCLEYREHLTSIIEGMKKACDSDETCRKRLVAFAHKRGLPIDFVDSHGLFYLSSDMIERYGKKRVRQPEGAVVPPKEERDKENLWRTASAKVFRYIGATAPGKINLLEERVVYPLYGYIHKDGKPLVCGLCGYDMREDTKAKYTYCTTPYFDKRSYLFGEERLFEPLPYKVAFVAEGLVDKLWLEYAISKEGYNMQTYGVCGVTHHELKLMKLQLLTDRGKIVYLPDRDKSGGEFADVLVKKLTDRKVSLCYVKLGNKDVAEYFSGGTCDFRKFGALVRSIVEGEPPEPTLQI